MQWVVSGLYAGSLMLYLVTKYYFENECKKALLPSGSTGDCDCGRGEHIKEEVAAKSNRRGSMFYLQDERPAVRLALHILHGEDQGSAGPRSQRFYG